MIHSSETKDPKNDNRIRTAHASNDSNGYNISFYTEEKREWGRVNFIFVVEWELGDKRKSKPFNNNYSAAINLYNQLKEQL